MMQGAIVILPFVDPSSGELKVCASDKEGNWQCNVNFLPASLSLNQDGDGLNWSLRPWKRRRRPRTEKSILTGFNPRHLNDAKLLVEKRLEGLEVVVTDTNIVLVDPQAKSRERVETARLWLSLAGQYVGLAVNASMWSP
jgi:hypothetical protein